MEEYNFNELTFKQFKELVINACFNNLLIKKEILKEYLKFKDEKAFEYNFDRCESYICYFKFNGIEYKLVYICPPASCWIVKMDCTLEEYMKKIEYKNIEDCIRSFLNENKI